MAEASNHEPNRADILHHCPRGGEANAFERRLAVTAGHRVPIVEVRFVVAALNAFLILRKNSWRCVRFLFLIFAIGLISSIRIPLR